ncbi:MerR family transcriptional regulator [Amycolatopsis sp. ATCC 39116]|uniref:MerR family transcriptional regulator n=1 Tax=Amycolatopsis sp. (strain ATCC 39116 / 75iv2) TaxID=385957 RepID=UPI0002628E18|nr:MerR family transcriptional regulator [Amycolatopsis sp. ATCC 39116]
MDLSIGEVARRTGLSVHTLRLYEREGLLASPVARNASGRRVYREADVEWLRYCTRFRASGMPLEEIRRFAALVRQGRGNELERLALLREHEERVRERIAELQESLAVIRHKVAVYEEHVANGRAAGLWEPAGSTVE